MEDLTDDEVLQLVYRGYRDPHIVMELAWRLERANDKLAATETQKGPTTNWPQPKPKKEKAMSLELALKENTAAVQALIDVWTKLVAQGNAVTANVAAKTAAGESYGVTAGGTPVTVVDPKPTAKASTPKVEAPKVEAPAPTPAADVQAPTTENAAPETAAESLSEEVVDMALLTKETTGAATRNRAGLVALLAEFGAARASAIPADKWAEYIAKVRAL